jgi:hypothetical protein
MERLPVELLYVLGFIAIVLFNFIAQRAARRRQQEEQAQAPLPPAREEPLEDELPEDELPEDVWGRAPAPPPPAPVVAPRPAPAPVLVQPPIPRRVHPARALLNDRRDLRRAVVLMMVLGPCRAQEPPER